MASTTQAASEAAGNAAGAAGHAAEKVGMPQLDFATYPNQIFWLVVALIAIYLILSRVALPRIGGILADRQGAITNDIAAAEDLKQKAVEAEAAYGKALTDGRSEASRIVAEARSGGGDIKAGVSFHGVYDAPPFPNAKITAKLLVCHGWNDPLCPPEATVGLANELTASGVDWQLIAYGHTGHAFTADNVPLDDGKTFGFQPDTNRRSWQAMQNFFAETFG